MAQKTKKFKAKTVKVIDIDSCQELYGVDTGKKYLNNHPVPYYKEGKMFVTENREEADTIAEMLNNSN